METQGASFNRLNRLRPSRKNIRHKISKLQYVIARSDYSIFAAAATAVVRSHPFSVQSSTETSGDWLEAADATCTALVKQRRREILEVYRHGRLDSQGVDCSQLSELYPGMRLCVVEASSENLPKRYNVYNQHKKSSWSETCGMSLLDQSCLFPFEACHRAMVEICARVGKKLRSMFHFNLPFSVRLQVIQILADELLAFVSCAMCSFHATPRLCRRCHPSAPAAVTSRALIEGDSLADSTASLVACRAFFDQSEMEYAQVWCGTSPCRD